MKYLIYNSSTLKDALTAIGQIPIDDKFTVEVCKVKNKRSLNQNGLWHKWIGLLSDEFGYPVEDIKIIVVRKALGVRKFTNPLSGELELGDYSTSQLTKVEFSKLMVETLRIASKYGIILPQSEGYR